MGPHYGIRPVTNESDRYRPTEPIGRPRGDIFEGWPPLDPTYPYGRVDGAWRRPEQRQDRQPIPIRSLQTPNQPAQPPEPFIANLATSRNTDKIAKELRFITWILLLIAVGIGVMLFCEIEMAVRLSNILSFNAVS